MFTQTITCATFVALLSVGFIVGCGDSGKDKDKDKTSFEDVKKDMQKALGTAGDYLAAKRDELMNTTKDQLSKLGDQFDKLEAKKDELSEEGKAKWEQLKADFAEKLAAAQKELGETKDASGEAWDDVKTGVENAVKELQAAFEKAAAQFKDEPDATKDTAPAKDAKIE